MIIVLLCYAGTSLDLALKESYAWSAVFAGYAFAQVGLLFALRATGVK